MHADSDEDTRCGGLEPDRLCVRVLHAQELSRIFCEICGVVVRKTERKVALKCNESLVHPNGRETDPETDDDDTHARATHRHKQAHRTHRSQPAKLPHTLSGRTDMTTREATHRHKQDHTGTSSQGTSYSYEPVSVPVRASPRPCRASVL